MKDQSLMETLQPSDYLDKNLPYVVFFKECVVLLVVAYLLEQVAVVCILHHDAISHKFIVFKR